MTRAVAKSVSGREAADPDTFGQRAEGHVLAERHEMDLVVNVGDAAVGINLCHRIEVALSVAPVRAKDDRRAS